MSNIKQQYLKELKKQLLYEMKTEKRGGIYGLAQRTMAYNSNRIEGSTLTERQTASMFETGTISNDDDLFIRTKDIEEMTGHFRMFNQTLQTLTEPLSIAIIKQMHYNLKAGVFEDVANGYPCGEFKNRKNYVSTITTTLPEDVPAHMEELISRYTRIQTPALEDLAAFHAEYENIHPFQDGNGRTARLLMNLILINQGYCIVSIPPVWRHDYITALQQAQRKRSPSDKAFIKLIAECELEAQRDYCRMFHIKLPTVQKGGPEL